MSDEPGIVDVIQAIAAGADVDWDRLDARSNDPPNRELLKALRVVSRVAAVHGTSTGTSPPHDIADGPAMPRTWDGLTILERLGTRSYGDVYRAWDSRLDREVALKLSRAAPNTARRPELDEGRLLARVRHPNVVTVYAAT